MEYAAHQFGKPRLSGDDVLLFVFFLLPLSFYLGAAGQAIGFYVFALLGMSVACLQRKVLSEENRKFLIKTGLCLLALHLIFPVTNAFAWLFHRESWIVPEGINLNPKWHFHLQSQFSSSVALSGVFLVLLGYFGSAKNVKISELGNKSELPENVRALNYFRRGLLLSTLLFSVYAVVQHLTGFDYRATGQTLDPQHQLSNELYRVFGFYGHPLSLSSTGLTLFVFSLSMLGSTGRKEDWWSWFLIAFLNFYFVFAGNGRTAMFVAVCFLIYFVSRPKNLSFGKYKKQAFFIVLVASVILAFFTAGRYSEIFSEPLPDRVLFWKVHALLFLESPFIGHGHKWLDLFLRNQSYIQHGLSALRDKFNAHQLYLEILANSGLLGFFWIVYWVKRGKTEFVSALSKNEITQPFAGAFVIAVFANLLHGFTQETFFDSNVSSVYLGLLLTGIWLNHLIADAETMPV